LAVGKPLVIIDDDVFGDIIEAYRDEVVQTRGRVGANVWLVRQLVSWTVWKARRSMKKTGVPVRKLMGAIRVSLAWQPLWWLLWALFSILIFVLQPETLDPGEGIAMVKIFGLIGLASGAAFALLLASIESGRNIRDLSTGRIAIWGILGTATVPLVVGKYDQIFPLCAVGMTIAIALALMARKGALSASKNPASLLHALCAWVLVSLQEATTPHSAPPSI
jgi:hypothetical protein